MRYDPNGMFDIKIHREIVRECSQNNGIGSFQKSLLLYGTGFHSDIIFGLAKNTHIDSRHDANDIASIYNNARNKYKKDTENRRYIRAGRDLHTIADFYSHSNYVELYAQYATENGLSMDIKEIPTFSEAQQDKKMWNFLQSRLATGDYSIFCPNSEDSKSHYNLNKDNPNSRNGGRLYGDTDFSLHDAAKKVAEKDINNLMKE